MGRPTVEYNEASYSTQQRLSAALAEEHVTPELARALELRKAGPLDSGNIDIKDMKSYTQLCRMLAMFLDLKHTSRSWEKFRKHNFILTQCNIYPPYKVISKIKEDTYPEVMTFSEVGAEADLVSLLQHTIMKLLLTTNQEEWELFRRRGLILIGKWGLDGASGQQMTGQKWKRNQRTENEEHSDNEVFDDEAGQEDEEEIDDYQVEQIEILGAVDEETELLSDQSVCSASFVPLQLLSGNQVIWQNRKPSSIYKCRPIEFQFTKENTDHSRQVYDRYSSLMNGGDIKVKVGGKTFHVKLDIKCTMIDGKTCSNALTFQNSTRSCNICKVGPSKVNDLKYIEENCHPNKDYYHFGVSSLHCWIKFFEYVLHVSYNLGFKAGAAITAEQKAMRVDRKKRVQEAIRLRLHMLVDIVRVGSGTTNTGNFFFYCHIITMLHKMWYDF